VRLHKNGVRRHPESTKTGRHLSDRLGDRSQMLCHVWRKVTLFDVSRLGREIGIGQEACFAVFGRRLVHVYDRDESAIGAGMGSPVLVGWLAGVRSWLAGYLPCATANELVPGLGQTTPRINGMGRRFRYSPTKPYHDLSVLVKCSWVAVMSWAW
jgi:hypothetical protein